MTNLSTKSEGLVALAGELGDLPREPVNLVDFLRQQARTTLKSEKAEPLIAALDAGKTLNAATAAALGPLVEIPAEELLRFQAVTALHRGVLRGEVAPQEIREAIEGLMEVMSEGEGETGHEFVRSLLGLLKLSLEVFEPEAKPKVGVAAKSDASRAPDRDFAGRRRSKPYGVVASGEARGEMAVATKSATRGPTRDALGRAISDPLGIRDGG